MRTETRALLVLVARGLVRAPTRPTTERVLFLLSISGGQQQQQAVGECTREALQALQLRWRTQLIFSTIG